MITTLKQAKEITGGGITNKNSKMPEANYDLSAGDCKTGSKLRKVGFKLFGLLCHER